MDFALGDPEAYRLMFDLVQGGEGQYPELVRATERARATMSRHVRPLIDVGLIEGDPEIVGHMLWAAVHGAIELKLAGKLASGCDFERLVQETTAAIIRGLVTSR